VEIDVSHSAVLARTVSLHVAHSTIGGVLAELQRQTGLTFAYDPRFPATRPVTLEAESITVAAALGAILVGTGMDVVLTRTGHVWLTESKSRAPHAQEGRIVGTVTDKQRGDPIIGATVVLDPTSQSATTGTDGRYRFANVNPGDYTIRARYIGYAALVASVAVSADQEATVDFRLEKSPHQLEEVVTTGTVVPTEVKALPTPVTVISENDITLQRPHTVAEVFRQAVPGAVGWDQASNRHYTDFHVRGATTLANQAGQMKIFVDGIEAARANLAGVDPMSIARIEVIRGPQAAAIYGSDAIGGVIQVFTKRGDPRLSHPQVSGEAGLGMVQTPYAGFNGVLRQEYKASVRGGGSDIGYNFDAGYSHIGSYLGNGEESAQSNPSINGGMHFERGIITADVSGRYYTWNVPPVFNPTLAQTGFISWLKPIHRTQQFQNQTIGGRFMVRPTGRWQHTITVGLDRVTQDQASTQPRLRFPADTLLTVSNATYAKPSVSYNTSLEGALGSALSGSLTAGFDHYSLLATSFFTTGALNTTGAIQVAPGRSISTSRSMTNNTGYFAQVQLGFRGALFLTGGLRAEQNSNFGDSLGAPVSPRAGLSYVQQVGSATFKLRGSWGRAIRPPDPGFKLGAVGTFDVQLANPQLGPERQKGWDTGVEAVFGGSGSLAVTYYDQIAENLIQYVQVDPTVSPPTNQFQNVGRVKNTGVEVEGTVHAGPFEVKAQYGYARARIEQVAPNYTGDLQIGDQALLTPKHTVGASLTVTPLTGTTVAAGLTHVGSWNNYDYVAEFRCFGGTGPCQPSNRDYIVGYPGFTKVNATVSQRIRPLISGFVSVDNLTNNEADEVDNLSPVMGRITTVGFQFQY
jgi:outer membrane receptor protein involved in Fe transport